MDSIDHTFFESDSGVVARWLASFGGALLPSLGDCPSRQLAKQLAVDFAQNSGEVADQCSGRSWRHLEIAFTTLRVGLSFSTYAVRPTVPNELERLLLSHRGNCSDQAIRLMLALDSLRLPSILIPVRTTSVPGHMIVDAYDPHEDAAYLLDSQFHVVIRLSDAGKGFLETWLALDPASRRLVLNNPARLDILAMPYHIRYCDPGPAALRANTITLGTLNDQSCDARQELWRRVLADETDMLVESWRRGYPGQAPRNLHQLAAAFGIAGLQHFGPCMKPPVEPLWRAAGLGDADPAQFQWQNQMPAED